MPGAMQREQEPTPPRQPTAKPVHTKYPVDMRGRTKDDLNRLGEPLGYTTEIANISGATHVVLTNEGTIDGAEVVEKSEPQANPWLRFKAWVLRIGPESQLYAEGA